MESRPTIRFDCFEVRPQNVELRKNGVKIHLAGHPFAVLLLLLERAGNLVSREELHHALWADDTHVDFEHSLNTAVKRLRQALGDSAVRPRFVETVPRHGYRFIGRIEAAEDAVPSGPVPGKRSFLRWTWYAAAGLVLAIAVGAASLWVIHTPHAAEPQYQVAPLTSSIGTESDPSFSPKGTMVAYSWDGATGDNYDIWTKLLEGGEPVRITNDPAREFSPAWSPDGRFVAFLRQTSMDRAAVVILSVPGNSERVLGEVWTPASGSTLFGLCGPYLAWGPDDEHLFIVDRPAAGEPYALFSLSRANGERRLLTSPPAGWTGDSAPALSPDGDSLAFARFVETGVSDLYMVHLSRDLQAVGVPERLTFDGHYLRTPAWRRDGRRLIMAHGYGSAAAVGVTSTGPNAGLMRFETLVHNAEYPTTAREGNRLACVRRLLRSDIVRVELAGSSAAGPPVRLISSTRLDMFPAYSPDGGRIAFISDRSGSTEVWTCGSDGSHPVRLTNFGGPLVSAPSWSPDAKRIAMDARVNAASDIYVIEARGGQVQRMTSDPAADTSPTWSRDGKWIYFSSRRSGRDQIWKMPSIGGPAEPVSPDGGRHLRDAFAESMTRGWPGFPEDLGPARAGVYLVTPSGAQDEASLVRVGPGPWRRTPIMNIKRPAPGISVSADGRYVVFSQFAGDGGDLMLAEEVR